MKKHLIILFLLLVTLSQVSQYQLAFANPLYQYDWDIAVFLSPLGILTNFLGKSTPRRLELLDAYHLPTERVGVFGDTMLLVMVVVVTGTAWWGLMKWSAMRKQTARVQKLPRNKRSLNKRSPPKRSR